MKKPLVLLCCTVLAGGCSKNSEPPTANTTPAAKPSYFQVDPVSASSISGTVHWKGAHPKPARVDMSSDPACVSSNQQKVVDDSLLVSSRGEVANAFVYIKSGLEGKTFAPAPTKLTIDQRGCWFRPHVLGAQTGQEIEIINSDPVTHNIHPVAHTNREWNHSQGPGDPPMHRRFDKPEIMIPVKCNIHSWMHGYIGVVEHPYFAVSGEDGAFRIPNLPPGTYTLALWHEKLGTREQQIVVAPHTQATVNFDLK